MPSKTYGRVFDLKTGKDITNEIIYDADAQEEEYNIFNEAKKLMDILESELPVDYWPQQIYLLCRSSDRVTVIDIPQNTNIDMLLATLQRAADMVMETEKI